MIKNHFKNDKDGKKAFNVMWSEYIMLMEEKNANVCHVKYDSSYLNGIRHEKDLGGRNYEAR